MKVSKHLLLKLALLFFLFPSFSAAQEEKPKLTGSVVKGIVEQFVSMHYSQKPLDDEVSTKIFELFLNRLDPAHYYFLQDDVAEFRKFETRVDDMLRRGNANLALDIFERFKKRLSERLAMMEEFVGEDFDFSRDANWILERADQPYPETTAEARVIWRTKIKFDLLTLKLGDTSLKEGKERLMKRVRGLWKDFSQYENDDVVSMYLNSMAAAYDPHSSYLAAQDLKNFDISIKLSLEGIGAVLRWEDGYTVVNSIVPGGAAARNGKLKPDDRIIAVAQGDKAFESVIDMRLNNVVQLIRGKRGTKVGLQVLRKTKKGFDTLKIVIMRDKIVLKDGEAQSSIFEQPAAVESKSKQEMLRIGVIKLRSFYVDFNDRRKNPGNYKSSSRDVKVLLKKFVDENVDGVILDLRNNGGGGLDEAINMAGLFIGHNPVVIVRQSGGRRVTVHRSRERAVYTGPLVIMLNRYSASASEILAGAMHDYQRAFLVGDTTTFGKGTVQNIFQLPEGYGALKVTIAQFYRVSGWSTQNRGVETSFVLPSLNNAREIGESTLDNALPWRSIDPVSYRVSGNLKKVLPQLKKLSAERIANSDFFQKIDEDVQEYLTKIKPLKYTSILKMQEDDTRRKTQRDQELAFATKKETEEKSATEESPESKKEIQRDDYMNESMAILADYINLQQKTE
ncbi:MAG TPA: tail-specific protease [Candidatus Lambdaproteobacteria bacterium]|nr:tail-specific protease [Candidatus Lambdaproteobacteria bacterium]HIB46193.1 tail-specific protease [Candidatus Lambdaproteobacteria bacterium]HIO62175.1 tail-specific protease [Deltaproteobacteria bacterium]HIO82863.1 tail-specific protease [Deltaproteobacteria bacterium]